MPRVISVVPLVSLCVAACLTADATIVLAEQRLPKVRVVKETSNVRTRPALLSDVLTATTRGTILEAVDREDDWYWVILPPDGNGRRLPGWIHARDVEVVAEGEPGTVLRHFAEAIEAAKTHDLEEAAKETAKEDARIERARLRVEQALREYEAATQKSGAPKQPSAPPAQPPNPKAPERVDHSK